MGKVQDFISRQKESYVAVIKRYAWTVISTIILSLIACMVNLDILTSEGVENVVIFLGFFAGCSFFIETVLKSRTKAPAKMGTLVVAYIIAAVVSIAVTAVIRIAEESNSTFFQYYAAATIGFIVLILGGLAMRRLVKDSELSFEKYAVKLMFSFMGLMTIMLVLNIGIIVILELINSLLVKIRVWKILGTIESLLAGTIYMPFMLICLNVDEEEDSKFSRGLILYALTPLYTAALAIVYMYIIKLIVTMDFPSNRVFTICASLFAVGVCIWTAAYSYVKAELDAGNYHESVPADISPAGFAGHVPDGGVPGVGLAASGSGVPGVDSVSSGLTNEWGGLGPISSDVPPSVINELSKPMPAEKVIVKKGVEHARYNKTFYDKLIIYMKYIYAPLILLELYCMGIRIHEYGFTSERLMGVWFMIAQTIYIAWEPLYNLVLKIRRKAEKIRPHERYEDFLFVGLVIYFLAVLCPLTSVVKLEYLSQKARFIKDENISTYRVLKNNMYGESYLKDEGRYGMKYELSLKQSPDESAYNYPPTIYIYEGDSSYRGAIPVEGAKYFYRFDSFGREDMYDHDDLKNYSIEYEDGTVTLDIAGLADDLLEDEEWKYGKHAKLVELPKTFTATDGTRVVLTYISCRYTKEGFEAINMKGYVLK